jgi:hypothetical protein
VKNGVEPPADAVTTDLLAGQTLDVGDVLVWNDGDNLYVQYVVTDPEWCLTETHLHVATSLADIPQTKKGNPIPGHFDYNDEHNCVTKFLYTIPLVAYGWVPCTNLFIAAHAVVQMQNGGEIQEETAWGDGERFVEKGNWGMYFTYTVTVPCPPPELINGSFEEPVVSDSTTAGWQIYDSGYTGLGWIVEWVEGSGGSYDPAHLELHTDWDGLSGPPEASSVEIYQMINTCERASYQVTFYYLPRSDAYDNGLNVYWNGEKVFSVSNPTNTDWIEVISPALLGAPGKTETELMFVETGTADSLGMFLDDVSVEFNVIP